MNGEEGGAPGGFEHSVACETKGSENCPWALRSRSEAAARAGHR